MTIAIEPNLDPEDLEDLEDLDELEDEHVVDDEAGSNEDAEAESDDDDDEAEAQSEDADEAEAESDDDDEAEAEVESDDDIDADEATDEAEQWSDEVEVEADAEPDTEAEADADVDVEAVVDGGTPNEVTRVRPIGDSSWTMSQLRAVALRAGAVLAVLGLVGFGLGLTRGSQEIVRTEFVYTLDESVPDSFLREDRRLLTQVVTLTSDAVLVPVAERFDLSVDDLRSRIDVQTVNLSEVLRLEVTDSDRQTALDISDAVVEQYLLVSSAGPTAEDNSSLRQRREDVLADLAAADADLVAAREADTRLGSRQTELERRIDLDIERVARLQSLLDDAELNGGTAADTGPLKIQLTTAENGLTDLRAELDTIATERSEVDDRSATQRSLTREVERLEADLATIDQELARRELGPLVASPVRELAEPTFETRSALAPGIRGAAAGILIGMPIAALVAYRARRRQLWFG